MEHIGRLLVYVFEQLLKNKEWLFSGIGVVTLVAVGRYMFKKSKGTDVAHRVFEESSDKADYKTGFPPPVFQVPAGNYPPDTFAISFENGSTYLGQLRESRVTFYDKALDLKNVVRVWMWEKCHCKPSCQIMLGGRVHFRDGSIIRIRHWTSGVFQTRHHLNLYGELTIFVPALAEEVTFNFRTLTEMQRCG